MIFYAGIVGLIALALVEAILHRAYELANRARFRGVDSPLAGPRNCIWRSPPPPPPFFFLIPKGSTAEGGGPDDPVERTFRPIQDSRQLRPTLHLRQVVTRTDGQKLRLLGIL